jgi:ribonuclease Z
MRKKSPLSIHYPKGCVEIESIHNAFMKVYSKTITYTINLKSIDNPKKFKTKNVSVEPFPVIHKEVLSKGSGTRQVPALGYKFNYVGTKICYGGDTAYCDELVQYARNSDLAIIEAGHDDDTPNDMHMTLNEAKSIGELANEYFLVHVPE